MKTTAASLALFLSVGIAQAALADDFRATPPAVSAAPALHPPEIREARLPNGIRVLVIERHGLSIVSIRVASDVGTLDAPPGAACLAARSAWTGAQSRSMSEFEREIAIEKVGGHIATWPYAESTQIAVRCLAPGLDTALELTAGVAAQPSFDGDRIEAMRSRELRRGEDSRWSARAALQAELHDEDPGTADDACASRAELQAVTREELREHFTRAFAPNHITLVVVGDTTLDAVVESATRWLGAIPSVAASASPESAVRATVPIAPARGLLLIDRAGDPQSSVALGAITAARGSPDSAPLAVLARAIEGGLYRVLRERRGFTYGFQSASRALRSRGEIIVEGKVEKSQTGEALRQLLAEIERLRSTTLDDRELDLAKRRASYGDPRYWDSSRATAEALANLATAHLSLDTWTREAAAISAVTADDVLRVARTYLDPVHVPIVVVGDAAAIRSSLPDVGGPVTVVSRALP